MDGCECYVVNIYYLTSKVERGKNMLIPVTVTTINSVHASSFYFKHAYQNADILT